MAKLDFDLLLAPISEQFPSGETNLEYDPQFQELELAATRVPEQEMGAAGEQRGRGKVPGKEPNWEDVQERASALMSRTKDVRVAVWLARALANQHAVAGLRDGLKLVRALLEKFWDSAFPPHADDDESRLNALAALVEWDNVRLDLLDKRLFVARGLGPVQVRDAAAAAGRLPARPDAPVATLDALLQSFAALPPEEQRELASAIESCVSEHAGLQGYLVGQVGEARTPDSKRLAEVLAALKSTLAPAPSSAAAPGAATGQDGLPAAVVPGSIARREDIYRILDSVCDYLQKHEPSSPAPLLLRRAKNLIGKNFLEIVEDIAPGGADQVRNLAGERK